MAKIVKRSKPRLVFSRPEDRSLAAYKAWINGTYEALTGKSSGEDDLTEEEWVKGWRTFWEAAEETRD